MAPASPITRDDVIEALRPVEDPELHRSIVDLNMVRDIQIELPVVSVLIALTIPGCPLKAEIQRRVSEAVTSLAGVDELKLEFTSMTDGERAALREQLQGDPAATAGSQQGHGHAEGRAISFAQPGNRTACC